MSNFLPAFWAESLKVRRSKVSLGISVGFLILPLVAGLFIIILKDPERARSMGLISMKAQLAGGVADLPTFFDILLQGTAIGGGMLFAFITAWVFGREFSDHTVKELLAVPTGRWIIVSAKFLMTAFWILGLTLLTFVIGLGIGTAVGIPGWSSELVGTSFWALLLITLLLFMLMPLIALFASVGRGYLLPIGWAFFTLVAAQIAGVLGWGAWFPWSVPFLASGMLGPRAEQVGVQSYFLVLLAFIVGFAGTFAWWQHADQAR